MISQWIRVIHSDNGVLTDYTLAAQNSDTIPLPMVAGEDFLYIGQHFPFNNFYADLSVANSNSATLSVDVWEGSDFKPAVDLLDETLQGGVTLSRSGVVQFSPDNDEGWNKTEDTSESNEPPELSTLNLYNLYWMRVKPSADLSAGTVINRLGYRFANTQQINSLDPDVDQFLSSWESGKTDWDEQLQNASEQVIADLKSRGLVLHAGQILRIDEVSLATAYKALSMIYTMLGPDFNHRRDWAMKNYKEMMDLKRFTLDRFRDGIEDVTEVTGSPSGVLVR